MMKNSAIEKLCTKCGDIKTLDYYSIRKDTKDGYRSYCKACQREGSREYEQKNRDKIARKKKIYRQKNKESISINKKEYYQNNKDLILLKKQRHYIKNKDRLDGYKKQYLKNNKEKVARYERGYRKEKRKIDIKFRISTCLRSRLVAALKSDQKSGSAIKDLGCSISFLKKYLEAKFQPGMSWNNWSRSGWHIDHIKPLSKFDLTEREELLKACHYSNLQPLWAIDNIKKSNL